MSDQTSPPASSPAPSSPPPSSAAPASSPAPAAEAPPAEAPSSPAPASSVAPAAEAPLVYRSSAYRMATAGAGAFLLVCGLGLAGFAATSASGLGGRFELVVLVFTAVSAGWMFLGLRSQVVVGAGEVRVRTKTRSGRFPVAEVRSFELEPPKLMGVPVGSPYVHVKQANGMVNTWVPAPGPVERDATMRSLNRRLGQEKERAAG